MANESQPVFNFKQAMRGYDKVEVETYIKDLNNSKNVSIKIYEQKVDELKEKLVLSNRERDALREKYAQAKQEADPIRQELNEAHAELADLKLKLEQAQQNPGAVMGSATYSNYSAHDDATYKSRINELTATVSQLTADLEIKEEKLSELQKAVDLKDAKIRDLEKTINEISEKSNLYDDLYARNAALLREHETLVDRFNALSANYQLTLDKRSTMEKQYQEAVDKYNLLSGEYESAQKDIYRLDGLYKDTLQKYNELCEEHNNYKNSTASIHTDADHIAEVEKELEELRAASEQFKADYQALFDEKEELKKDLETKTNMVTTLAHENEFQKTYSADLEEKLKNAESGAAGQSDEVLERFAALEAQMDEKSAVINELREAKNALEAEYSELIKQMETEYAESKAELEEQIKQKDEKLKQFDGLVSMFSNFNNNNNNN